MDSSPRMYEEGSPDIKNNLRNTVFNFTEEGQSALSLDPALETVVDIQELLNTTLEASDGPLNIDNIFPAGDLDLAEGHTSTGNYLDISKFVPETVQKVCMTNSDLVSSTTPGESSRGILTIKAEDLQEYSPCQGYGELSPQPVASPDSYTHSGKGSSLKLPVIYECRKPGRKPSANGPIRPRKREPTKDTPEYFEKRARNNIAVRKSREKAKLRQGETETRVSQLTNENERLQKKVDLLTKELNVLKSLFINVGAALPENFEEMLSR